MCVARAITVYAWKQVNNSNNNNNNNNNSYFLKQPVVIGLKLNFLQRAYYEYNRVDVKILEL